MGIYQNDVCANFKEKEKFIPGSQFNKFANS